MHMKNELHTIMKTYKDTSSRARTVFIVSLQPMKTKGVTNERVVKIGRVVAVNRPLDEQQRGRGALSALRRRRVTSQRDHLRMREHLFSYCPRP